MLAIVIFFLSLHGHEVSCLQTRSGALVESDGQYRIVDDFNHPRGIARAVFLDADESRSGWGQLLVRTSPEFPDDKQMWAAGYLEGYFTASRIYDHHVNMKAFFNVSGAGPSDWLLEQDSWTREQVHRNKSSPLWNTMHLILEQHEGVMDGYNAAASQGKINGRMLPRLERIDFLLLSAVGVADSAGPEFTEHHHGPSVPMKVTLPATHFRAP
jgi:hypothetical protein